MSISPGLRHNLFERKSLVYWSRVLLCSLYGSYYNVRDYEFHVQMPRPWMGLHEALAPPHCASPARRFHSRVSGEQISALNLSPDWSWRAHCGVAVAPPHASVGHGLAKPHAGAQMEPSMPWIWMGPVSSSRQPPETFGSS